MNLRKWNRSRRDCEITQLFKFLNTIQTSTFVWLTKFIMLKLTQISEIFFKL